MTNKTSQSSVTSSSARSGQVRNLLIAISALVLSVVLFLGVHNQTQKPSLTVLAESSMPLETALGNGQPTVLEFYADWCTSCQSMAADVAQLRGQYSDVNFVMLNVDNTKWLPEISHFEVDGIPHFVFMNRSGDVLANVVGQQPRVIIAGNISALAADQPLPEQQVVGQASTFSADTTQPRGSDDPRSHGGFPAS